METAACDGILAASFIDEPSFGETTCDFFRGTSVAFAAAQVSAAAALLKAAGVGDPEAIRERLNAAARDLGPTGFDPQTGHGLLDVFTALGGGEEGPGPIRSIPRPPAPPRTNPFR